MRILIIGGHFTPALALIEHLPKKTDVLYAGRKYALEGDKTYSLEYQTIKSRGIPFASITTGRLQRQWTKHTLSSLFKLPIGFFHAYQMIQKFKPTIIMGFGGYVQIPVCLVGKLLEIPIVIHEQTLEAGLANKIIALFATKICISWKTSGKFFPREKIVLTGNPAVSNIIESTPSPIPVRGVSNLISSGGGDKGVGFLPTIVIVGGSLGSHAMNTLVGECLEELVKHYNIIHQTGDAKEFHDFEILQKAKKQLPSDLQKRYMLTKFIDPSYITVTFQQADLVISRAGMNTVTTLLMLNKPALFIPLSVSQHDEQKKNALFFKKHGLGEVADQNSLTSEKFLSLIHTMIKNRENYYNKVDTIELMVHKSAIDTIIQILSYAEKNSSQTETQKHS